MISTESVYFVISSNTCEREYVFLGEEATTNIGVVVFLFYSLQPPSAVLRQVVTSVGIVIERQQSGCASM